MLESLQIIVDKVRIFAIKQEIKDEYKTLSEQIRKKQQQLNRSTEDKKKYLITRYKEGNIFEEEEFIALFNKLR